MTSYWEPPMRDPLTVENEQEIQLAFADRDRPTLTCGYCGDNCRRRNVEAALIWFHHHKCVSTYA